MIGKPMFCDVNKILDAAEEYIQCDDGQKALWILDNLPAYWQDNYPARAYEIKKTLFKKLWTIQDYLTESFDAEWNEERALAHYNHEHQWRKDYVKRLVKAFNDINCIPHIVEVGPANYWLPVGLRHEGFKFKYQSMGPNVPSMNQARDKLKDIWSDTFTDQQIIFVCMEVVEHCFNPQDVFHYFCKIPIEPDYIVLTTPRYMIGGGRPDWRSRSELNHVKTWGAGEFQQWAVQTFPAHNFTVEDKYHLVLNGFSKRTSAMGSKIETVEGKQA